MASFFETAWFFWWLIAIIVIGHWCWITFLTDRDMSENNSGTWRERYRSALLEGDTAKMEPGVQEAEGAIQLALAARLFRPQDSGTLEPQDELNNSHKLP
jgi:hypothetical protein